MAVTSRAPDVYSKIVDLSRYVDAAPSTWGFLPVISERGVDNELNAYTRSEFLTAHGEPNLNYTGNAKYGFGPYVAEQFLSESDTLFTIRCLPDDAMFANVAIKMFGFDETGDTTSQWYDSTGGGPYDQSGSWTSGYDISGGRAFKVTLYNYSYGDKDLSTPEVDGLYTYRNLQQVVKAGAFTTVYGDDDAATDTDIANTFGEGYSDDNPDPTLVLFYGRGRGAYYNNFQVDLNPHPLEELRNLGVYVLDIYKRQTFSQRFSSNASNSTFNQFLDYELIESYDVSFDPDSKDYSGNSNFIEDVLNAFSEDVRVITNTVLLREIARRQKLSHLTSDDKLIVKWEEAFKTTTNNFNPYNKFDPTTATGYTPEYLSFLNDISSTYGITDENQIVSHGINLSNGSEGSLFKRKTLINGTSVWSIDEAVATQVLSNAYLGRLKNIWVPVDEDDDNDDPEDYVDSVLDADNFPFDVVLDAGYPDDVKSSIASLVNGRRDCIAFVDNGDNKTAKQALRTRDPRYSNQNDSTGARNTSAFNSRYMALYEPYTKVYDSWTGKDLWVPPTYHIARIIPFSDKNNEVWYPLAGFQRAAIQTIKSLRYNPSNADRSKFIEQQLNPITRFTQGYAVFSQRTTLRNISVLQDINVVRLVLYIERALKRFCREFIFELNLPETWERISKEIDLFLRDIQDRKGLYGYSINVGANEMDIRMRRCKVDIVLRPTRAIEIIELSFFV